VTFTTIQTPQLQTTLKVVKNSNLRKRVRIPDSDWEVRLDHCELKLNIDIVFATVPRMFLFTDSYQIRKYGFYVIATDLFLNYIRVFNSCPVSAEQRECS
jgi:hypothetical protein